MIRGGEMAAGAAGAALILATLTALAGLATASVLFGGGWVWPDGSQQIGAVLGSLFTAHPGRGLPPGQARLVAGATAVRVVVIALEVLLLLVGTTVAVQVARYRRPGDARGGMATRRETRAVLGVSQLRSAKSIIRPDLYPQHPKRSRNSQ